MDARLDLGIAEAGALMRAGELSPVELVDAYLDRIAADAGELNAFRAVCADSARAQARAGERALRRREPPGALCGIPIALKDNIALAGTPMTAGTPFLSDCVPGSDAAVVERLRRAGAVILGKLHMSEWAIGGTTQNLHYGPGRNAWDRDRVPGGSSGGSAAAVAADMALATLGTDTGGSIRIPAALSGVCGLRPTAGRVSNRGTVPVSWTLDAVGPLARRAGDVARMLSVIAGFDHADPTSAERPVDDYVSGLEEGIERLRIGVLRKHFVAETDPALADLIEEAAATFGRLGARVDDVELTLVQETVDDTADLLLAEAAAFHRDRLARAPDRFAPDVLARLRRGEGVSGTRYAELRQRQRAFRRRVLDALAGHDLLVGPAAPMVAPRIADSDPLVTTGELSRFIAPLVLARVPVLGVPCGFLPPGLPVGMQLIGRPFREATLLRAAHAYQGATDWHLRRPDQLAWLGAAVSPKVPASRSSATCSAE